MAAPIVFPETDQAEWLNRIIAQMWPYVSDFMQDILKKNVEPKVKEAVLSSFTFTKVDLGTKPLRVDGVKVYNIRKGEIYMDLDISYDSDADIDVGLLGIDNAGGIRHLKFAGSLRVAIKPLVSAAPLIGGISIFFITNPILEFDLTNLANIMDIPMLKDKLHSIIQGQLSNMLVYPKRMEYIMGEGTKFTKIHCPRPQGVLKVTVVEAKDLRDADTFGKDSDPFAVVKVGDQMLQTEVINNNSNPQWNQTFDMLVDLAEENLDINIFDHDKVSGNDSLGHARIPVSRIIKESSVDEWLTLAGVDKGRVQLSLQWFYLANDPVLLDKGDCPRCLLMICVHSAQNIAKAEKSDEPSIVTTVSFAEQVFTSTAAAAGPSLSWEEDFRFLVTCSEEQKVSFQVKDTKKETVYGTAEINIKDLIGAPDMALDQSYPLVTSGQEKEDAEASGLAISVKMVLRVLTAGSDPKWLADSFQ